MNREMKHSGIAWIGEIPKSWNVERIKTIYSERSELSESGSEELLSVSEYYGVAPRSSKVEDGDFVSRSESLVGYKKCYKGDFVSNIMLAWKGSFGTTQFDGIVSPAYCVYIPSQSIHPQYYHYLFRTDLYKTRFHLFSRGIIDSRLRLYSPYFFNVEAIIPPLAEQKAIADFLDKKCGEIDELVALQEKIIEELKSYKQSVITETVCKGLNPNAPMKDSGVDWIGEIPEKWDVSKLKYYLSISSGEPVLSHLFTDKEGYPIYGGGNVMGYCKETNVSVGHILVGRVGSCGNVVCPNSDVWATDNALIITPRFPIKYMYYLLTAANLKTLSTSNAQPLITATKIKNVLIPLSSLSEQQEIADYLDKKCSEIDQLISIKQQKIVELKDYKKSLIYEYTTGKKEVKL